MSARSKLVGGTFHALQQCAIASWRGSHAVALVGGRTLDAGLGRVVTGRGRAGAGCFVGGRTLDALVTARVADGRAGVFAVGVGYALDALAAAQAQRRGPRARGTVTALALAALALAGRRQVASQRAAAAVVEVAVGIQTHRHVLAAARRDDTRPRAVVDGVVAVVVLHVADVGAGVNGGGAAGQEAALLVKRWRDLVALGDREAIDLAAVTARHGARDTLAGLDAADLAVLFEVHAVGSIGAAIAVFVRDLAGHAGLQPWLLRAEALGRRHAVVARARTGLAHVVGRMRTRLDAATHAVTRKAARSGINAPARALVVVGTGQDALHGLGCDHVRLNHRHALVVGVLLVDKAVAVVVFAIADFSGKRALGRIGVVAVHIRVIAVAVAVHGARPVGDAVLRLGIAALVGRAREGLRVGVVAVQRHAVRVTARIGVGEAVAVHVAGLAASRDRRTAVFRHAVAVRVLIRTAAALVRAQPSHSCRDRAATLLAL